MPLKVAHLKHSATSVNKKEKSLPLNQEWDIKEKMRNISDSNSHANISDHMGLSSSLSANDSLMEQDQVKMRTETKQITNSQPKEEEVNDDEEAEEEDSFHSDNSASYTEDEEDSKDDEMDDDSESSDESSDMEDEPWIDWFLGLPGHHLLLKVNEEFIEDDFNLTDLSSVIPYYKHAKDMIFDIESNTKSSDDVPSIKVIRHSAKLLYTLIHARYVLCKQGMMQMAERYEKGYYGVCPRFYCHRTRVIPIGLSDIPLQARIQVYCPSCDDVYQLPPLYHRVDGAAFGSSFSHIFFKSFPALDTADMLPPVEVYQPRVYGFKLYRGPILLDMNKNRDTKHDGEISHSSRTLGISYRGYTPDPLNMTWLRRKPNYHRLQCEK